MSTQVDKLSPPPEQLVLTNTFADVKLFIKHMVGEYFYPFVYAFFAKNLTDYDIKMLKDRNKWTGHGKLLARSLPFHIINI